MQSYNSFEVAQTEIKAAAKVLNLDKATLDLLLWPQREFKFTLPVKMDDGATNIFTATGSSTISRAVRQGRDKISPGRNYRYHAGSRWMDDVEISRGRHSLGRRQRRGGLRSAKDVRSGTRKHSPCLCARALAAHRHRSRRPGPRCLHQSADNGVDDG